MRKALTALTLLFVAVGIGATLWFSEASRPPKTRANLSVASLLGEAAEGFARTDQSWRFAFPDDHGAHSAYRTETWYFTGNLSTRQGRRFSFQLAFVRLSLSPDTPSRTSHWATNQIYRGHFALTDIDRDEFHAFERFSRAALGLSGAQESPISVWLENWTVTVLADDNKNAHLQLRAEEGGVGIDLHLQDTKPAVLSGDGGLFGGSAGASPFHVYLVPRLIAQGTVRKGSHTFKVEGFAWLDRAWGEVPLSQGQIALNRFTLQLEDEREIMCLQLRRRDGGTDPVNTGLLVMQDGAVRKLGRGDIIIDILDDWASPQDGARYPARWRLRLPAEEIELDIVPYVADQEMNFALRYWGGAVRIVGSAAGKALGGAGYVELTGYAEEP